METYIRTNETALVPPNDADENGLVYMPKHCDLVLLLTVSFDNHQEVNKKAVRFLHHVYSVGFHRVFRWF